MSNKNTITIIGMGRMGEAIATGLSNGKDRVLLFDRTYTKAEKLANKLKSKNTSYDVEAIDCEINACWEADIIIPAVPYSAQAEVAKKIKEKANQKIVIGMANPFNKEFNGLATDTSAGEELQKQLPNSKVVKAFNTIFSKLIYDPVIDGEPLDCYLAGNDPAAVDTVSELVKTIGFNPVEVGDISASRTLELMSVLLIKVNGKYKFPKAGWKLLHN